MIAPTSVSSRLSARPVTPLPKSSISLSIVSVRPSIFATPSPISRTTPTFCFAVAAFAPLICASISCNRLLIFFICHRVTGNTGEIIPVPLRLKTLFQFFQTHFYAAVVKVAADLNPQTADERRILAERNAHARAIFLFNFLRYVCLQIGGQRRRAFNARRVLLQIHFYQPV